MGYFHYLIITMLIVLFGFGGGIAAYNLLGGMTALLIYYAAVVCITIFLYKWYERKNKCPNQK